MNYEKLYSETASGVKASAIRELLKVTARPEIISFAGGLPDPTLFPSDTVADILYNVVKTSPRESLQYGTTEGQTALKTELVKLLKETEDIDAVPEQLLVVSASQQALDMTARVFLNRGDAIITASPTYLGALQAFEAAGAAVVVQFLRAADAHAVPPFRVLSCGLAWICADDADIWLLYPGFSFCTSEIYAVLPTYSEGKDMLPGGGAFCKEKGADGRMQPPYPLSS